MPISLQFQAVAEDVPGEKWHALFERAWPSYRAWFLRSGVAGRPSYLESRRAMRTHMPELVPTWERLVELIGGGDVEARFLSLWCPPPYIAGCSQAVWIDPSGYEEPMLLRNYDFAPALLEGNWLATRWVGSRVAAMGDCLWGALDGMNDNGLAASLSFGGRTVSGIGFGIPLVLRYVLEIARTTAEAVAILQRVPVHMSYSVTLLDSKADWATVFVNPDRPTEVTRRHAVTNFQNSVEWPEHARATRSRDRLAALQLQIVQPGPAQQAINVLLQEPLYQNAWQRGYGTLYSAVYRPMSRRAELRWPEECWDQSLHSFDEGSRQVILQDRNRL
ncbi:C45 family peptidase [Burkholderia ubonensis]|uniref:C45 family peptidase n=1 Tax=Burkholderia ubonensis TaxID=101571 RepID=UPI002ABE4741|nr:C45 family peptidase [Burkholderia ubonensis]